MKDAIYCQRCCELFEGTEDKHPGVCPTCRDLPCPVCGKPLLTDRETCSEACGKKIAYLRKKTLGKIVQLSTISHFIPKSAHFS